MANTVSHAIGKPLLRQNSSQLCKQTKRFVKTVHKPDILQTIVTSIMTIYLLCLIHRHTGHRCPMLFPSSSFPIYLLCLIHRHTGHWCPMLFPSSSFPYVFWSSILYLCHRISFLFFFITTEVSAFCTLSLDPLFLTLVKFPVWDWLWCPMTCDPRGGVGVRLEQKSRSKFLPWPGFEPRTSRLAVQHTTR